MYDMIAKREIHLPQKPNEERNLVINLKVERKSFRKKQNDN